MIAFAVELLQLGFEVRAHVAHDLFAARQLLLPIAVTCTNASMFSESANEVTGEGS
ncbi:MULTISPECIES: hypothetical protein [unclassified Streptomyces]|uniref:hypothetical protein n=1 Tax=unclassified Streptomyces TaxID=2593676 RepID=UPI0019D1DB77|nr:MULTISPECIES: hypothetical protein [unclassified Streptomyces]